MIPLLLSACVSPFAVGIDAPPTTAFITTTTTTRSVLVTSGTADCTAEGDARVVTVRTDGWTSDAWLTLRRPSDDAFEDHPLPLVDTDLGGAWDERSATLGVGADTQLACDAVLAAFVVVLDADGAPGDCVQWGADAADEQWMRDHDAVVDALGGCRTLP